MRREKSKWSEKNKALVKSLEERGLMTDFGRKKIEEAKKNGQWHTPKPTEVTEEQIACVSTMLEGYEPAWTNFQAMLLSVKKTYTRAYFDAKTDAGREKRIAWMVDRLNKNLKPMWFYMGHFVKQNWNLIEGHKHCDVFLDILWDIKKDIDKGE